MNKILQIAKKKLSYSRITNQLGGYLTPVEIHALIQDGFKPATSCPMPKPNEPQPKPRWFYFKVVPGSFYSERE